MLCRLDPEAAVLVLGVEVVAISQSSGGPWSCIKLALDMLDELLLLPRILHSSADSTMESPLHPAVFLGCTAELLLMLVLLHCCCSYMKGDKYLKIAFYWLWVQVTHRSLLLPV